MPLGTLFLARLKFLNAPPIYLAVLGLILVFVGVVFDVSNLVTFGVLFTILGFFLSILWKIIDNYMKVKQKKRIKL